MLCSLVLSDASFATTFQRSPHKSHTTPTREPLRGDLAYTAASKLCVASFDDIDNNTLALIDILIYTGAPFMVASVTTIFSLVAVSGPQRGSTYS